MRAARGVSAENITQLCQLLRGHGWMTAREIRGLRPEWDERIIRRLASASGFRIISYPGSPGYRLAEEMTQAEIEEMETILGNLDGKLSLLNATMTVEV